MLHLETNLNTSWYKEFLYYIYNYQKTPFIYKSFFIFNE